MNWDAIGAIGQAVSALALIIVIVQIRHARAETRRSMSQGRSAAVRELCMHKSGNELLNRAEFKARVALGWSAQDGPFYKRLMDAGLTGEEVNAVIWDQFAFWHYREASYLDELTIGIRTEFESGIKTAYGPRNLFGRLWYETLKSTPNPDFVRYVDNLLAQPG